MVISLVSQDKLTISMFVDFLRTVYDRDAKMLDLNSLNSLDMLNSVVKSFVGYHSKVANAEKGLLVIRLKTKRDVLLIDLPSDIDKFSHYIIKFDMFSMEPIVLKSTDPLFLSAILERWKKNIESMNKLG